MRREQIAGLTAIVLIAVIVGVAFATATSPKQAASAGVTVPAPSATTATVASVPSRTITTTTTPAPTTTTGPTFVRGASSRLAVLATNRLGLAMLARLSPSSNLAASPFSVESAMAMIDQGATGQTAAQLDAALGGATRPSVLALSNRQLGAAMVAAVSGHGAGGPTLDSANGVWLQTGLTPVDAFRTALSQDFGAQVQPVDFEHNSAGALKTINGWVSQHTEGLIRNLLSSQEITNASRLVLANAVYLHAKWSTPFRASDTHKATFAAPHGAVQVPFMTNTATSYPYVKGRGYVAVGLPYAHSSLQFLAIMPSNGTIAQFQRTLSLSALNRITRSLRGRTLDLSMPKFTLTFKTQLKSFLQGLGIRRVFSDLQAQLGGMVPGQKLFLSFVAHAAKLKVDETGTTAAAATAGGVSASAVVGLAPTIVKLDHPFLVFIRDIHSGAVLFAARVIDPAAAQG